MTTLQHETIIDAPMDKIWSALSNIEELEKYDPTVQKVETVSIAKSGLRAERKVRMKDGKNWFEEKCTVWEPNEKLTYELSACSFPVQQLKHSYHFEKVGNTTKVVQVMTYKMKFGMLGKLMDALLVRRQTKSGIRQFFSGLKAYAEQLDNRPGI